METKVKEYLEYININEVKDIVEWPGTYWLESLYNDKNGEGTERALQWLEENAYKYLFIRFITGEDYWFIKKDTLKMIAKHTTGYQDSKYVTLEKRDIDFDLSGRVISAETMKNTLNKKGNNIY